MGCGVKSFRIDDETMNKFKNITEEIGGNQQQTLAKLIECYEMQRLKSNIDTNDIEEFEGYVSCIVRKYIALTEDKLNLTETVKTQFIAQINEKDLQIKALQKQVADLETLKNENDILNTKIEELQKQLNDKEELNRMLSLKVSDNTTTEELQKKIMQLELQVINLEKEGIAKEKEHLKELADMQKQFFSIQKPGV